MNRGTNADPNAELRGSGGAKLLFESESYQIRRSIYQTYQEYRNYHKEEVYHNVLIKKLGDAGFDVVKNKRIFIYHKDERVGTYVPDIVVNDKIVIELKCKATLTIEDRKQFWHYLKSTEYRLGFLVNFGRSNGVEIERRVFDKARRPHSPSSA